MFCFLEAIWKKIDFSSFLHISKGPLLSQFLSYIFQNFYTDVNLHFEQVLFFMFIKNVDSLADIHGFSFFHGGHLGFWPIFRIPQLKILYNQAKMVQDALIFKNTKYCPVVPVVFG